MCKRRLLLPLLHWPPLGLSCFSQQPQHQKACRRQAVNTAALFLLALAAVELPLLRCLRVYMSYKRRRCHVVCVCVFCFTLVFFWLWKAFPHLQTCVQHGVAAVRICDFAFQPAAPTHCRMFATLNHCHGGSSSNSSSRRRRLPPFFVTACRRRRRVKVFVGVCISGSGWG